MQRAPGKHYGRRCMPGPAAWLRAAPESSPEFLMRPVHFVDAELAEQHPRVGVGCSFKSGRAVSSRRRR